MSSGSLGYRIDLPFQRYDRLHDLPKSAILEFWQQDIVLESQTPTMNLPSANGYMLFENITRFGARQMDCFCEIVLYRRVIS